MKKIILDFSACENINGKLFNQNEELTIGLSYKILDKTGDLHAEIYGTEPELKYFYEEVYCGDDWNLIKLQSE